MALNLYAGTGLATMYDIAARVGAGGRMEDKMYQRIVELQAQKNDIWQVMPFKPCNNGTKEVVQLRESLPDIAWRMINKGTKPVKTGTSQASYTTGGKEAFSNVDERALQMNKNSNMWRMTENDGVQTALSNQMSETIFYGDEKINPAGFTGFGAHYYAKEGNGIWSEQIIDAGGTGNSLTSLWVVTFGMDTVYGITPENVPAGYRYKDNGRIPMQDKDGNTFWGYQSQFNWDMGIAIRDPRYVVRLANIDTTDRDDTTFIAKLIEAVDQIYDPDKGRTVILCNRKVNTYISILAQNKNNVNLRIDDFAGKKITHFWQYPILRNDAILNTESQVQ